MNDYISTFKKYLNPFFTTRAAGVYMLLFAIAIGVATFVENDFGTSSAQKIIFKARWFELLLFLFSVCILVNVSRFRMIQNRRWALLTFHLAMIVILIGSAITRYFSFEGIMHIRENEASNSFLSSDTYLQFEVIKDDQKYSFDEPVLFATLGDNNFSESYLLGSNKVDVEVNSFIPNPKQILDDDPEGPSIIKLVIAGMSGREEYFIQEGETRRIKNLIYTFNSTPLPEAFNISYRNDSLLFDYNKPVTQMVMATQKVDTLFPESGSHMLRMRSLYSDGVNNLVFGDFRKNAAVSIQSESPKVRGESMTALKMNIAVDGESKEIYVYGKKGLPGRPTMARIKDLNIAVSYGARPIYLPFAVKLYDFQMEKYPGTNSAMSYASEVQLIDDRKNIKSDHRIYMNHILDYDGYRFFQSSFDKDEQGTYLSVNHDFIGTWVSYLGYFLLTMGLIMSLFSKKSRFQYLSQSIKKLKAAGKTISLTLLIAVLPMLLSAQKVIKPTQSDNLVSLDHAHTFSQLIVQDHNGRMKPVHTLTRELMRKMTRKEKLNGRTADQIILGMMIDSRDWNGVPMIKLGQHEKILQALNLTGPYAAYNDFFNSKGEYVFRDEIRRAYSLQPIDRTVYEKELMKIDERINIASMVYSGRIFRIIPVPGDPNNIWVSNHTLGHNDLPIEQPVAERFFSTYIPAVKAALESGDYSFPNKILEELKIYQQTNGTEVIPSQTKIKAEILLNNLNVFNRLSLFYLLLGLAFLTMLFLSVFNPKINLDKIFKGLFVLVILAFVFHTIGLGLRWYVSGRAPWSNGYESMIYIAWTTCLAGLLFTRKSVGGLAATMVLSATVLLVANLSYLDPEITPLVPVLRSYWLTIHVSLEAGSYGFLMLGALTGLINLILMIFLSEKNKEHILRIIKEMSMISEMTLFGGLIMVSVGTYLGGIWANESWGRYWGWDAKETWALVTILVYAFILHMRLIPKLNGLYAYNLATLFGWASVIMTYYGVNYYLSGLHSYAAGDPIPIPTWVYYAVATVIVISALAYWRKRKFPIIT